jgi:hypothetical protein
MKYTTTKMSLISLATSIGKQDILNRRLMAWILNQIEYTKLSDRCYFAKLTPEEHTKCVLLEYNYVHWAEVRTGIPDVSDRLPGTDSLVHPLLTSPEFKVLALKYIVDNDPRAYVYVRTKINKDGTRHPYRRQLVLAFSGKPVEDYPVNTGSMY